MKSFISVLPVLAVVLALGAPSTSNADAPDSLAKPTAQPSTPEPLMRPNWFYYVKGAELVRVDATPLETRVSAGAGDAAAGLLWGGGGKTWMTLAGATSEAQISEAQPRFRVATQRVVALMLRLGVFEVRKDKRWSQTNLSRSQEFYRKSIPLEVKKVGDDLYEISPSKPLEPGEYAFAVSAAGPVTDFTIVAPEGKKSK